ncbi:MAG: hypothetical protein AAGA12_03475 [Pseudomonadota bacterium]
MNFSKWTDAARAVFFALCASAQPLIAEPDRKVIVVPGIVGSVLEDDAGQIAWGQVDSLLKRNFDRLNLLPEDGAPVALQPKDALREIPLVFGAFDIGFYGPLIDFMVGDKSFKDVVTGQDIFGDYTEGEDLFVFAYDWRRSNFSNAQKLNDFVKEKIPDGERFDIVAHSMGGLVTRLFLSDRRPVDACTSSNVATTLSSDDLTTLCNAVYGDVSGAVWPSDAAMPSASEAARLHTFIEIAVPHKGSVNVAGTLTEGWGKISELLLGGKRNIQNNVLSMTAPYELVPTYENCCAMGVTGAIGNNPVPARDESYWADLVLGFGKVPCPYSNCDTKRRILQIGLANRGVIDQIIADGLPSSVEDNHVIVGRQVKGTKETVYVKGDAGDGEGLSYRFSIDGDGTVYEGSAKASGNLAAVLRSSHPFIVGSEETERYIYNFLVDPIADIPDPVNDDTWKFAGGTVIGRSLEVAPHVATPATTLDITLDLSSLKTSLFEEDGLKDATVVATLSNVETGDEVGQIDLSLDEAATRLRRGVAVYRGTVEAPADQGVYTVSAVSLEGSSRRNALVQQFLYILEEE